MRPLPPELRRYLKRATRGLPRAQRLEVQQELHEHVLARQAQLMACGVPEPEALSRALHDLGGPGRVAVAMNRVYTVPTVLKTAALSALLAALSLSVVNTGFAQVGVTYESPRRLCPNCALRDPDDRSVAWLNLNDLREVLTRQGVAAQLTKRGLQVSLGQRDVSLRTNFFLGQRPYASIGDLLYTFGQLPGARLSGYDNPVLSADGLRIALGKPGQVLDGAVIYQALGIELVNGLLRRSFFQQPFTVSHRDRTRDDLKPFYTAHSVKTKLPPNAVVMVLYRDLNNNLAFDIGPVGADGMFNYATTSDVRPLRFVTDLDRLDEPPRGGQLNAVLLRFTGELNPKSTRTEIVLPR